jgi:hypothetical protein
MLAMLIAVGLLMAAPVVGQESQTKESKAPAAKQEEKAPAVTPAPGPRFKDENKNDICDYREAGDPQGRMNRQGCRGQVNAQGRMGGKGQQWRHGRGVGKSGGHGCGKGRCCGRGQGKGRAWQGQGNPPQGKGQGAQLRKRDGSCLTQKETEEKKENPPAKK